MCELFCFNSKKEKDIREYLSTFYNHCNAHPHGWGLTDMTQCIKEPIKAQYSSKLENILSKPFLFIYSGILFHRSLPLKPEHIRE